MNITILNDTDIKGIYGGDHVDGYIFGGTIEGNISHYLFHNDTGVGMEPVVSKVISTFLPNDDHNA